MNHFNIRGFFDLSCTQGKNTTEKFQELALKHGFFRVIQTGWSKLDPLFSTHKKLKQIESDSTRFNKDTINQPYFSHSLFLEK